MFQPENCLALPKRSNYVEISILNGMLLVVLWTLCTSTLKDPMKCADYIMQLYSGETPFEVGEREPRFAHGFCQMPLLTWKHISCT